MRGICDVLEVVAAVGRHLPEGDPLQGRVPARGVIRATLPGMVDGHKSRAFRVAGGRQVAVPGEQTPVIAAEEGVGAGDALFVFTPRSLPDTPDCYGVDGGLAQPAGARTRRRILRKRGGVPALRIREVALWWGLGVEDYVWDLARRPLAGEEGLELVRCAAVVHVREAKRDERGVPTPLVRIQGRGWFGPGFQAVAAQDVRREWVDAVEAAGPWPFRKALWKLFLSHEPVLVTPSTRSTRSMYTRIGLCLQAYPEDPALNLRALPGSRCLPHRRPGRPESRRRRRWLTWTTL